MTVYGWHGWDSEPELSGDGTGCPETYFITITRDGEEYATICHRTVGGKYPLEGSVAGLKMAHAQRMVAALQAYSDEETASGGPGTLGSVRAYCELVKKITVSEHKMQVVNEILTILDGEM